MGYDEPASGGLTAGASLWLISAMLLLLLTLAVTSSPVSLGKWEILDTRDAMTDGREVRAILPGEGGSLVFMCANKGKKTWVAFLPETFVGGGISNYEWRDFTYRLDDAPPIASRWKYGDQSVRPPNAGEERSFLNIIASGQRLRVRAQSYDLNSVDASFELAGAESAIREVESKCIS